MEMIYKVIEDDSMIEHLCQTLAEAIAISTKLHSLKISNTLEIVLTQ
jgi:hypothetical protein